MASPIAPALTKSCIGRLTRPAACSRNQPAASSAAERHR